MSIDRGVDKEGVVHIYTGILFRHKMNEDCHLQPSDFDLCITKMSGSHSRDVKRICISHKCCLLSHSRRLCNGYNLAS